MEFTTTAMADHSLYVYLSYVFFFCVSINIPMHIHKRAFNILIAMENMYWLRESHIAYSLKNIIVGW